KYLPTGTRVVIFCEKGSSDPSADELAWQQAESEVFARLPERVGLVLGGTDVEVEPDDPHYLELQIDAPRIGDSAERVRGYEYVPAAFRSDRPAIEDALGFGPSATALARFVLHPDTGPLTIGIHGRWGKGKSSFMRFVDDGLIAAAASDRAGAEGRLEA